MNTDVEDLLREGMERVTADLRAPVGLAGQAARRRRRLVALQSAAGMTAVLTAGAVAVALAAGALGTRQNGAEAAAYVVKRVSGALSAAEPGQIAQMTVITSSAAVPGGATAATTAREWSYDGRWRSITYYPAGHPVYDEGLSGASVYTVVDYKSRAWARERGPAGPAAPLPPAPGPRGCKPAIAGVPLLFHFGLPGIGLSASSLPATVATALRTAVSCGTLAVSGRQHVNGIDAIKLTSRPGSPIAETIWVSPGTYLPVRVVFRPAAPAATAPAATAPAPGTPGTLPFKAVIQQTANITWLPPTTRNLAKLTVPIPAGFRQVSLPVAVAPVLRHLPAGPLPSRKTLCLTPAGPSALPPLLAPGMASAFLAIPRLIFSCPAKDGARTRDLCGCKV